LLVQPEVMTISCAFGDRLSSDGNIIGQQN